MTTVTPVVGLTTRPTTGTNWQAYALCREVDADLFFPEVGTPSRDAKETCFACEVRAECLAYALDNNERVGIWGGLNERERRQLRKTMSAPAPKPKPVVVVRPVMPRPEHGGGLPLAPCGTEAAYRRHKRYKEPVDDACAAGHKEWLDKSRERRRKNRKLSRARARERNGYVPKQPPPCGTSAAAYRHKRRGEPVDEACRLAYNAACREQDRRRRAARIQAANAEAAPQPKAPREPAPCGTYAAWKRHKRQNEPIDDACHTAFLAKRTEDRRRAGAEPRQPAECGTRAGYQRHLRLGEQACDPCRQANTDADNRLRRTGTTKAA